MSISEKEIRVDPRVKRTRRLLQQAFVALIAEQEFEDITVQDIVARAEVNRATFYLHFEDKFALFSTMMREKLSESLAKQLPESQEFTRDNLRKLAAVTIEFFRGTNCHANLRNTSQMLIGMEVQEYLYEKLLEWMNNADAKLAAKTVSPEEAAATLSFVLVGAQLRSLRLDHRQTPEQLIDHILLFLEPSLCAYFPDVH